MKQISFLFLLAAFFVGCNRQCPCKGGYALDNAPCDCVIFQSKIGNDLDSALDSLEKYYEPELKRKFENGFYSGKGYLIEKEKIDVDFLEDDRGFFHITFVDSAVIYRWLNTSYDILDEKGNYYILIFEGRKD